MSNSLLGLSPMPVAVNNLFLWNDNNNERGLSRGRACVAQGMSSRRAIRPRGSGVGKRRFAIFVDDHDER
eukprot:scaffold4133_cov146-Amphora_coffeaeformis.AAC.3